MHIPSNRVRDIERYCHDELDTLYGDNEVAAFVRILFEGFLGWDTAALLLHRNDSVNQSDLLRFHWAVEDLKRFRPIQHIVGYTSFCGCRIDVDGNTLIPRPETAELVEWVAQDASQAGSLLDVGTGSGCIAVSLANRLPDWKVQGWDISDGALEVARENSRLNGTEVEFRKVDILNASADCKLDVIVSNPPYVMESEKSQMEDTVLDYEPHLALFVSDTDPLLFYRAIAEFAHRALNPGGKLYFEINPLKVEEMKEMLMGAGYRNVEVRNDIFGKPRMIKAIL